jgi:G:T-mismatch repair DNA endonuclease (very short patch repair protein)
MPRIKSKSRVTFQKSRSRFPKKAIRKVNRRRRASTLEATIHDILDEEGVVYVKEKTIGRCHADIFIAPKLVVELAGCYWHGCTLCFPHPSAMQKNAIAKDARRFGFFRRLGFDVYVIWEHMVKLEPMNTRLLLRALAKL